MCYRSLLPDPTQPNRTRSYPTHSRYQTTIFPTQTQTQKTSFPELTGRSVREAVAYLSARGLKPVLAKPNQMMIMDYRPDRVRIITDPSERVVLETPRVG